MYLKPQSGRSWIYQLNENSGEASQRVLSPVWGSLVGERCDLGRGCSDGPQRWEMDWSIFHRRRG